MTFELQKKLYQIYELYEPVKRFCRPGHVTNANMHFTDANMYITD